MVGVLVTGAVFLLLGVAALVGARHLLPRLGLPDEYRAIVQLLVALGAGLSMTLGLLLLVAGALLG